MCIHVKKYYLPTNVTAVLNDKGFHEEKKQETQSEHFSHCLKNLLRLLITSWPATFVRVRVGLVANFSISFLRKHGSNGNFLGVNFA